MLETIVQANAWLNGYVWGAPMIVLLMGTGLLLTVLTGAVQFRYLGFALREVLGKLTQKSTGEGDVTPFQAVATALASTVGVGNIAGVATALTLGGPGALFWLWISGLLGMCTKFAEIVIALHYREPDSTGTMRGGAMYTLSKGLGLPWLGTIFALLTSLAAFGIGNMVQANSVADSLESSFGIAPAVTGVVLAVLTAAVILGGIKRIGEVTQVLVPFMSILYLGGGLIIIALHIADIPGAIALVFEGAFSGTAATGGFAGATVGLALRFGIARGLFSNEAGLGSAPMVHSAAKTDHPVRQGLYGIFEVFVDTVLVCTITGLAILVTGAWTSGLDGATLSGEAFRLGLPGGLGNIIVTASVLLFSFSTVIGWSYYGETGIVYLFGAKVATPYRIAWLIFIYLGATGSLQLIWSVADTLNGLMAIPNLVSVLFSIPILLKLTKEFFGKQR
ncbi:MAG: sodium:alanine symporter family protein [Vicinamibacterales bacterium]|jgi:AGCS family alanine or glycine:cation symporter|nr:sodium:alanine symporter family protein [Acidobacteriota bacterium]MDP7293793.1 sodium:alanine symporter family protein [Vicinamibacterales bacterium]MDP7472361.1 sodium:alanine symporter family protein [Vicinamibacterales bacterium]MDP7670726.1 sodium:alanine symporter family protein [Vicinamibacterales bacterium]HJO38991.1 sodium:alanine symporter family protein [Vicinamibacterales bacterium]|tara:strand:- start:1445 stop:2791 length:1347 start_codon:yes stop_codon:yes gene_type:complete